MNCGTLANGAGDCHSSHGGDLEVDDDRIYIAAHGGYGSCCRILVVDQLEVG
jgi:hypothetical protein